LRLSWKESAKLLLSEGLNVDIFERTGYNKLQFPLHEQIDWHFGDYPNEMNIAPVLNGIDIVYLFASTTTPKTSNDNYRHDIESNLVATVAFLDIASTRGIKKIIFPSSGGTVYGILESSPVAESHANSPICSYGINKIAIENYLILFQRQTGMDYAALRISNPFGPFQPMDSGQGVIATFLHKAIRGEEIEILGDGSVIRDFIYLDDVARAFMAATNNRSEHRVFYIGSGTGHNLNPLLSHIEEILGKKCRNATLRVDCLMRRKTFWISAKPSSISNESPDMNCIKSWKPPQSGWIANMSRTTDNKLFCEYPCLYSKCMPS
jgi:UDP-glucose 4-epimerase